MCGRPSKSNSIVIQQVPSTSYPQVKYASELSGTKQAWILALQEEVGCGACVYGDIHSLSSPERWCLRHKAPCLVPRCDLSVGGWSCKDLSKLSLPKMKGETKTCLADGTGSSGYTFQGLLQELRQRPTDVYIGENVEEISDINSENRHYVLEALGGLGYLAETVVVEAQKFGSPAARTRTWVVALHCDRLRITTKLAHEKLNDIVELIHQLQLPAPPMEYFLLETDDERVRREYERSLAGRKCDATDTVWQGALSSLLLKDGVTWSACEAPSEHRASPWWDALAERERKNLAYTLMKKPDAGWIGLSPLLTDSLVLSSFDVISSISYRLSFSESSLVANATCVELMYLRRSDDRACLRIGAGLHVHDSASRSHVVGKGAPLVAWLRDDADAWLAEEATGEHGRPCSLRRRDGHDSAGPGGQQLCGHGVWCGVVGCPGELARARRSQRQRR